MNNDRYHRRVLLGISSITTTTFPSPYLSETRFISVIYIFMYICFVLSPLRSLSSLDTRSLKRQHAVRRLNVGFFFLLFKRDVAQDGVTDGSGRDVRCDTIRVKRIKYVYYLVYLCF